MTKIRVGLRHSAGSAVAFTGPAARVRKNVVEIVTADRRQVLVIVPIDNVAFVEYDVSSNTTHA